MSSDILASSCTSIEARIKIKERVALQGRKGVRTLEHLMRGRIVKKKGGGFQDSMKALTLPYTSETWMQNKSKVWDQMSKNELCEKYGVCRVDSESNESL